MKKILATIAVFFALIIGGGALVPVQAESTPPPVQHEIMEQNDPITRFDVPHLVFHYNRSSGNYTNWKLWIWDNDNPTSTGGADYEFNKFEEDYGKYLYLPINTHYTQTQTNIIIKEGNWDSQTADINIQFSDFTFDNDTNAYHFYLVNMQTTVYKTKDAATGNQILNSNFTSRFSIKVSTNNIPTVYVVKEDGVSLAHGNPSPIYVESTYSYDFNINLGSQFVPDFKKSYTVEVGFGSGLQPTATVGLSGIFNDPFFIDQLTYDGNDLGVTYTPESTTFKAWAPTALDLKLRIYDSGTPVSVNSNLGNDVYTQYDFNLGEKGVWSVTLPGNLHGKYYTFVAHHATGAVELVDPYAKSTGVNGLRGMIVDFDQTNPTGWDLVNYPTLKPTEIIPYELHVADLTSDDTWNGTEANRKKFRGLIESGTTYTSGGVTVKTGFDHIKELGINALQIIPFYDQQNDEVNPSFNWGYNPQNYNTLEGSYSSNPYDGLVRIREFKEVVKAYAAADIRIIMDVVYNHVASLSAHSFNKLVPGYYFRYEANGSPNNSSGVGNVTASEHIMMENFMRDSTAFWVEEYKIGGFRFDLMGLHTTKSMETLSDNLKTIRDDIVVFGEAWDMDQNASRRPTLFHQENVHKVPAVGAFNDQIRDSFVGNGSSPSAGWVQMPGPTINDSTSIKNRLRDGMLGKIFGKDGTPTQTVNYAAVHDNYTLHDKLQLYSLNNSKGWDKATIAQQSLQVDSMVLLSQGMSFIHAGSEILRSKPKDATGTSFDYNSYQSSYEINAIKWDEKIDNLSMFNYYQQLIGLKRNAPAFQYTTRAEINSNVSFTFGRDLEQVGYNDNLIQYIAKDADFTYTVIYYSMGSRQRLDGYEGQTVVLDTSGILENGAIVDGKLVVNVNTTIVLKQSNNPDNPGNSSSEPKTSEEIDSSGVSPLVTVVLPVVGGSGIIVGIAFFLKKKKFR